MTTIQNIKIFLASSSELREDRQQFEIFINRKNKEYIKDNIFLELIIWEDFLDAMSATRLQDEYNKAISECDVFVSLFQTKVGQYTEEEFTKAFETFKANQKPLIYTYFKNSPINLSNITTEINTLLNFKAKLDQLGHFYTTYTSIEDLKYRFDQQLNKLIPELKATFPVTSVADTSQLLEIEQLRQEIEDREKLYQNKLQELEQVIQSQKQDLEQFNDNPNQELLESLQVQIDQLQERLKNERSQSLQLSDRLEVLQKELSEKELIIKQLQEQINNEENLEINTDIEDIELKSEKGIDYTKLRGFLVDGKWKYADRETANIMLKLIDKKSWDEVKQEDLLHFPCTDLHTIDSLWLKYSDNKFGFSVQYKVWVECIETVRLEEYDKYHMKYIEIDKLKQDNLEIFRNFKQRNGWRMYKCSELTYDLGYNTSKGHLPVLRSAFGYSFDQRRIRRIVLIIAIILMPFFGLSIKLFFLASSFDSRILAALLFTIIFGAYTIGSIVIRDEIFPRINAENFYTFLRRLEMCQLIE